MLGLDLVSSQCVCLLGQHLEGAAPRSIALKQAVCILSTVAFGSVIEFVDPVAQSSGTSCVVRTEYSAHKNCTYVREYSRAWCAGV